MKQNINEDTKIVNELDYPTSADPWAVVWTDGDNVSHMLISSNTVRRYYRYRYGDFYCENMHAKFDIYNIIQAGDLYRALQAWDAEYNPLDNYNGKETRVIIDNKGAETTTRENDPEHNKVTTAALTGTESAHYTTTDDSDTARLETKDTTAGGTETTDDVKTTTEKTRGTTTLTVDGTSYTAHDVHGDILTKAGNLGVTTTQQMITSECEMRLNPVQKNYLDRFIYEYGLYVGGAW